MRVDIYGIYDAVSHSWVIPLRFERNDDAAKRSFSFEIQQNKFLADNARDYELYWIGYFDDEKGCLVTAAEETDSDVYRVMIMRGDSVVLSKENN